MSLVDIFKPRDGSTGPGAGSGGNTTLLPSPNIGGNPITYTPPSATDLAGGYQDNIQSIYDYLGGGAVEPSRLATEQQINARYGVTLNYEDLAQRGLLSDAELAQRGLALDQSNVNIGRGAANRDLGAIAQLLGINDASLGRNINSVEQLLELVWQSRDTETAGINLSADINRRGLTDDSVARGAYNAPGTRRAFTDIERETELARAATNINARQSEVGLYDRADSAREEHARTRIGLDRQAGDARDTLARLDNEFARLGLNSDQIRNTLNMGLERLGLEHLTNADDLIQRLNSNNVEHATMAQNIFGQAAQLAGLPGIADIVGGR